MLHIKLLKWQCRLSIILMSPVDLKKGSSHRVESKSPRAIDRSRRGVPMSHVDFKGNKHSIVVMWVKICQIKLMAKIYSKSRVRAIGITHEILVRTP